MNDDGNNITVRNKCKFQIQCCIVGDKYESIPL